MWTGNEIAPTTPITLVRARGKVCGVHVNEGSVDWTEGLASPRSVARFQGLDRKAVVERDATTSRDTYAQVTRWPLRTSMEATWVAGNA